jgi:hypothetical protein
MEGIIKIDPQRFHPVVSFESLWHDDRTATISYEIIDEQKDLAYENLGKSCEFEVGFIDKENPDETAKILKINN